jgi:predicted cupin superfamily sugar epimerase
MLSATSGLTSHPMTDPASLIESLKMTPHPEGGHFAETFRADDGSASLIFYLLQHDERSHWHRLTKNEMLHFYDGDPLKLLLSPDGVSIQEETLGREAVDNESYHLIVPKGAWFSMQSTGAWSLIGCAVCPAFSFDDFELAPQNWSPGHGHP